MTQRWKIVKSETMMGTVYFPVRKERTQLCFSDDDGETWHEIENVTAVQHGVGRKKGPLTVSIDPWHLTIERSILPVHPPPRSTKMQQMSNEALIAPCRECGNDQMRFVRSLRYEQSDESYIELRFRCTACGAENVVRARSGFVERPPEERD